MAKPLLLLLLLVCISGCATRKTFREEIDPLAKRSEALAERLEALQRKLQDLPRGEGEAVEMEKPVEEPAKKEEAPAAATPDIVERLYGRWVSEEVNTKAGPTINTIEFRRDGTVRIDTRSTLPLLGHLRTTEGPFRVEGETLTSDSIEGGTTVKFRFEGDDLLIETKDQKTIRLHPA